MQSTEHYRERGNVTTKSIKERVLYYIEQGCNMGGNRSLANPETAYVIISVNLYYRFSCREQ